LRPGPVTGGRVTEHDFCIWGLAGVLLGHLPDV